MLNCRWSPSARTPLLKACAFIPARCSRLDYQGAVIIARRGSWNRTVKNGYDVVRVNASAEGKNPQVTPFVTGFLDKEKNAFWGRPVDVMQMPDGSMLVADEQNGAIYRVSHKR